MFFAGCTPLFFPDKDFHLNDGVHLNYVGQYQLYHGYRGAILRAIRMLWIFVTSLRLSVCIYRLVVIYLRLFAPRVITWTFCLQFVTMG